MCIIHITEAADCGHTVEEDSELCTSAARNHNIECDDPQRKVEGRVPGKCNFCREADMDRINMDEAARVMEASRQEATMTEDELFRATLEASRSQALMMWEADLAAVLEASKKDAPEMWQADLAAVMEASKIEAPWVGDGDIDAVLDASRADFAAQKSARGMEMEAMLQASMKERSDRVARAPKEYYRFCVKFACRHQVDMGETKIERQSGAVGPPFFTQDDPYDCPDCQGKGGSSSGPGVRWEAISRPKAEERALVVFPRPTFDHVDEPVDLAPGTKGKGARASANRVTSTRVPTVPGDSNLAKQIGSMAFKQPKTTESVLPSADEIRRKRLAKLGGSQTTLSQKRESASQYGGSSSPRSQVTSKRSSSFFAGVGSSSQRGTTGQGMVSSPRNPQNPIPRPTETKTGVAANNPTGLMKPLGVQKPAEVKRPVEVNRAGTFKSPPVKVPLQKKVAEEPNPPIETKAPDSIRDAEKENDSASEPETEDPDWVRKQRLARFK